MRARRSRRIGRESERRPGEWACSYRGRGEGEEEGAREEREVKCSESVWACIGAGMMHIQACDLGIGELIY